MKLKYNFVSQKISDGYIAVAVGSDVAKFGGMIKMNKVGNSIFEMLKEETTIDEIVGKLLDKYDAGEDTIRKATEDFMETLKSEGVLED